MEEIAMVIVYRRGFPKIEVAVLLKNFSRSIKFGACNLHTPDLIFVPDISSTHDLELRGLPYVLVCEESVEAYAGIFSPVNIFYSIHERNGQKTIILSDDAWLLLKHVKPRKTHSENLMIFMEFGVVLGDQTLVNNMKVVEAGKKLVIEANLLKYISVFKYGSQKEIEIIKDFSSQTDFIELYARFFRIVAKVFKEYIPLIRNKTVIVPLSAGVDSKFVLSVLHLLRMKDIITVTYGPKDAEYPTAKKIAEKLGYENVFIEYNYESWRRYLTRDLVKHLADFSQLFRTPNVQEYILTMEIYRLCKKDVINCEREVLFITGDISNVIAGKMRPVGLYDYSDILNSISLFGPPYPKDVVAILKNFFFRLIGECKAIYESRCDPYRLFEIVNLRESEFKYISTIRIPYKIYGFKYIAPLWDARITSFLLRIPWNLKYKNKFYENFLVNNIFHPLEINFKHPTKGNHIFDSIKHVIGNLSVHDKLNTLAETASTVKTKFNYVLSRKSATQNPLNFHIFFPLIYNFIKKSLVTNSSLSVSDEIFKAAKTYTKIKAPRSIIASITIATLYSILPEIMEFQQRSCSCEEH